MVFFFEGSLNMPKEAATIQIVINHIDLTMIDFSAIEVVFLRV